MRIPLFPVIIAMIVSVLLDTLIYRKMRRAGYSRFVSWGHVALSVVLNAVLLGVALYPKKSGEDASLVQVMWTLFAYMSVFIPKIILSLFIVLRVGLAKLFKRRLRGITYVGSGLAFALLIGMWWGALVNRYSIDVSEVEVPITNLPAEFDGFTIAQISDFHVGTYGSDTTFVAKVVDRLNSLHPDMVAFTGDIVNRHAPELEPFVAPLSRLSAPYGVWSIMGNHDYGDYYHWPSKAEKEADIRELQAMQAAMGWTMLNNDHAWLRRGGDSIAIIGVENIGDPPFHIYGSLERAYPSIDDTNTKILLSHNPVHWCDSIADNPRANIALTLSGHTHAMQFTVLGMSPSALRYKTWGGLYDDTLCRHLYVNVGLGTVGFPSRVGATPEITLITLKSK